MLHSFVHKMNAENARHFTTELTFSKPHTVCSRLVSPQLQTTKKCTKNLIFCSNSCQKLLVYVTNYTRQALGGLKHVQLPVGARALLQYFMHMRYPVPRT